MRLVTRLVKYSLLGCMGQVLQQDLWQELEPVMGRGGRGSRSVLTRSCWRMRKVTKGGEEECWQWRDQIRGFGYFL